MNKHNKEKNGRNEGLKDLIKKKLAKGKSIAQIADEIEESEETVLELIKQIEAGKFISISALKWSRRKLFKNKIL
ncbi:MAG: hypothetical protein MSH21_02180 [Clostridium sp.]|uniref:hypothetical protein n=1 Tax=Butyribacter sp. TaxID=2822465 RepID=UPI002A9A7A4E|nr:hypothetical protein [Clostridium sp.]MDY5181229.1 hypothetical protein [Butyribacter sp.]